MSIRTTADEVSAVLGPNVTVASGALDSFIADASLWIDNYLDGVCSSTPEDKLPTIEKYLAAGLYTRSEEGGAGQLIAAARKDISERYAERKGNAAPGADFFEIAAAFDMCGIVAEHFLGRRRMLFRVGAGYNFAGGT